MSMLMPPIWPCRSYREHMSFELASGLFRTRIAAMMNSVCACGAALLVASVLSSRIGAQSRSPVQAKDVTVLGFKIHYLEAGSGPAVP